MNRSEKAALIAQIKAKADAASFVVVTDFKGMTVEELTRLRAKLYECGGEYLVVKNTLARIALTDGMHDSVKDMFKENCGIALTSQDPVAVAKAVSEFAKTSKLFTVRHASLEGDRREKGCLGNPLNTQAKVSKEQSHGRYQRRSC